jgi:hypothetical protein
MTTMMPTPVASMASFSPQRLSLEATLAAHSTITTARELMQGGGSGDGSAFDEVEEGFEYEGADSGAEQFGSDDEADSTYTVGYLIKLLEEHGYKLVEKTSE